MVLEQVLAPVSVQFTNDLALRMDDIADFTIDSEINWTR
jgi:hypothetical protein